MERVGFQNFVADEACLEEGNCLELLLLLLKSFLVPDVKDCVWVLDLYVWGCLGLDCLFGSFGILNDFRAEYDGFCCWLVLAEEEAKNLCCCALKLDLATSFILLPNNDVEFIGAFHNS